MKIIPYKQHNHIGYCVYFLYDKNEIVYIGYTFNLGKRLGEHSQWINSRENHRNELIKKQFTHYSIIPMNNGKKARELESKLIKKHYPNVKQSDPRHKELLENYLSSFYVEKLYRSNQFFNEKYIMTYTHTGLVRNVINEMYFTDDDLITH